MVSVRDMHTSCTYGAPRRFDDIEVFLFGSSVEVSAAMQESVGVLFC